MNECEVKFVVWVCVMLVVMLGVNGFFVAEVAKRLKSVERKLGLKNPLDKTS